MKTEIENFPEDELTCKCGCGFSDMSPKLLVLLQALRYVLGFPLTITSACRCESHNRAVGGYPSSRHKLGQAIDISTKNMTAGAKQRLLEFALFLGFKGIGIGKDFIHLDVRDNPAIWTY